MRRYSPDGTLDEGLEVPAPKVTACTFGGDGLDTLFITTSQEGVDTDEDPLAGSLFGADVGGLGTAGSHLRRLTGAAAPLAQWPP